MQMLSSCVDGECTLCPTGARGMERDETDSLRLSNPTSSLRSAAE